jgi:pyruvate-formate lyase-activating enzyme
MRGLVFDIQAHSVHDGPDNALTLRNLRLLGGSGLDCFVVVRIPLIPGGNDDEENLRASARFVRDCGLEVINLLPFHRLCESKWRQLGRDYPYRDTAALAPERLRQAADWIRAEGITCCTGWETPF